MGATCIYRRTNAVISTFFIAHKPIFYEKFRIFHALFYLFMEFLLFIIAVTSISVLKISDFNWKLLTFFIYVSFIFEPYFQKFRQPKYVIFILQIQMTLKSCYDHGLLLAFHHQCLRQF